MSSMSFMEKLLDGVEVNWKPLGMLGELVRGNGLPKTDFTEVGVPAIHYGQIYTYYGLSATSTKSFVSPETAKKLKQAKGKLSFKKRQLSKMAAAGESTTELEAEIAELEALIAK